MAASCGLSSQDAQRKLHTQLEHLCRRLVKVDWPRELRQPPFAPLVCLGTALAGLLLLVSFSLSPERDGSTLAQGLVLLLLSAVNTVLYCWEVYIVKTQRIRRLLSKIKPFLESRCPWAASSYPSRSIGTLRGHFTVHTHRDGQVVNLPVSLLVQGDVIELYRDVPLPARATVLDSDGIATDVHVEMGSFPPPELFEVAEEKREGVTLVEEEKRTRFVVTQTPVIATFHATLLKKKAASVLTRQKTYSLVANNAFLLVVLGVALFVNVIRYSVLREDVGHWTEMLIQLQVYVALPLLHLLLPGVWAIMNLYGTATIVLLTERSPDSDTGHHDSGRIGARLNRMCKVFKKMVALIFHPSMYPNYRVFHILGSLTSLCSVDKEYVLTDSAPVPEKVFFLTRRSSEEPPTHSGTVQGEQTEKRKGPVFETVQELSEVQHSDTNSAPPGQSFEKANLQQFRANNLMFDYQCASSSKMGACVEVHIETASVDGILSPDVVVQDEKTTKSTMELDKNTTVPSTELVRSGSDSAILTPTLHHSTLGSAVTQVHPVGNNSNKVHVPERPKFPLRFLSQDSNAPSEPSSLSRVPGGHDDESQGNRLSQALSSSVLSLMSPFQLVSEILDLSADTATQSGLGFDDTNWEMFLGSLKPIGVNCLATSHFLRDPYSWSPCGCSEYVRSNLCMTNCVCPLGVEIGVGEYLQSNFTNESLLFSVSDAATQGEENIVSLMRHPSTSLLSENIIQPHLLSSVLKDKNSHNYLIMSRGSGEMVAACCSDFWDGKDLQPMTVIERGEIEAFFARRHLTSYCVTLSYNPLVDVDLSSLSKKNMALYVPKERLQNGKDLFREPCRNQPVETLSGDQLFSNLLCNQVFLGVVSLQFQPKSDIVSLIEDLELTGIRFVYFTNENEVRGKVFAEKLGLEAGWNCHISLAPGSEDDSTSSAGSRDEQEFASRSTSTSSSLNSVINAFQSYIRAKLPKGVHNIRPHLSNVDNVPLLVPLFTDCTVDGIREMIEIMQENGEVVMCLGNAWNHDNLSIFAQADVGLSVVPESASLQCCLDAAKSDDGTLSTSVSDNNFGNPPPQVDPLSPRWPSPLEMASYLNTAMCQLCVGRQSNVKILDAVTESRHLMSCIRHGLLFGLGASVSISILMLTATIFFLPPPLSGGHIFFFLLFSVPVLSLSLLFSTFDPNVKKQMPSRKKKVLSQKLLGIAHFCVTFLPSVLVSLLLFAITLSSFCADGEGSASCHPLLGDRNESTLWNGWRGVYEHGLWVAQDVTALFVSLHLAVHSLRFVHRTAPLWQLYKYISWLYVTAVSSTIVLQIIYFGVSQALADNSNSYSVPPYIWAVGIALCVPLVFLHEMLKCQDRKLVLKLQRHLKLEFETKLGMNSPF